MKISARDNFFDVLNIPTSFHIDEEELTRIYLNKQSDMHPDVLGSIDENVSLNSAYINLAYKTLMDPISRAEHFLAVKGIDIDSVYSTEFSREMFNIREAYSLLSSEADKKDFIVSLKKRMSEIISLLYHTENDLQKFSDNVCLLRFINSFIEKVGTNVYSRN